MTTFQVQPVYKMHITTLYNPNDLELSQCEVTWCTECEGKMGVDFVLPQLDVAQKQMNFGWKPRLRMVYNAYIFPVRKNNNSTLIEDNRIGTEVESLDDSLLFWQDLQQSGKKPHKKPGYQPIAAIDPGLGYLNDKLKKVVQSSILSQIQIKFLQIRYPMLAFDYYHKSSEEIATCLNIRQLDELKGGFSNLLNVYNNVNLTESDYVVLPRKSQFLFDIRDDLIPLVIHISSYKRTILHFKHGKKYFFGNIELNYELTISQSLGLCTKNRTLKNIPQIITTFNFDEVLYQPIPMGYFSCFTSVKVNLKPSKSSNPKYTYYGQSKFWILVTYLNWPDTIDDLTQPWDTDTNIFPENMGIRGFNKYRWFTEDRLISWMSAEARCQENGGHLVSINSHEEFLHLTTSCRTHKNNICLSPFIHIGLKVSTCTVNVLMHLY